VGHTAHRLAVAQASAPAAPRSAERPGALEPCLGHAAAHASDAALTLTLRSGAARQAKLREVVLPLALLYAAHAHAAVALAAHGLFCAVLRAADEVRRPGRLAARRARCRPAKGQAGALRELRRRATCAVHHAPAAGAIEETQRGQAARPLRCQVWDLICTVACAARGHGTHAPHSRVPACTLRASAAPTRAGRAPQKEPLAPYYARRALAAYPARTPLAGLTAGYAELARALPVGSAAASLALRRLAARAGELLAGGRAGAGSPASLQDPASQPAAQGGGQGGPAPAAGPGRAQGMEQGQAEVAAGLGLVRLLAQLLLLVDLQVGPRMPQMPHPSKAPCAVYAMLHDAR